MTNMLRQNIYLPLVFKVEVVILIHSLLAT